VTQPTYPQPTYPAAPPPQEPKKKSGVLKWILIAVGIFVLLLVAMGACVAMLAGEESATPAGGSAASTNPSPNASEVPTAKIGEKVTDDSYQFTVSKISCGVRRVGDQYDGEKAQGQFCLVTMKVKNVGKDPITFSDQNQALVDTKGRTYSPDDEAWAYVDDPDDIWGEINPGNTLKTVVPFDVPNKTEPDYLLLKAGTWGFSEGVRVKL
jgi:archaellum component FlaG (FlaF/FlaG flagellin family)